ncbi:MAG TPA: tetratricopeptide repeat protein [Chloroflexi bacterium]|nr:tetratricopeptide repeat protein [Chloroflexota bacterium]
MADAEGRDPLRQDARFDQAMAHLQAGRWQEAIQAFEALLQDYPEDATVKRALEDARFRAQQDQRARVRPRRTAIAWRPIIVRLLLVAVVGAFAYMGYQFLDKQIAPTLAQAQTVSGTSSSASVPPFSRAAIWTRPKTVAPPCWWRSPTTRRPSASWRRLPRSASSKRSMCRRWPCKRPANMPAR